MKKLHLVMNKTPLHSPRKESTFFDMDHSSLLGSQTVFF